MNAAALLSLQLSAAAGAQRGVIAVNMSCMSAGLTAGDCSPTAGHLSASASCRCATVTTAGGQTVHKNTLIYAWLHFISQSILFSHAKKVRLKMSTVLI